MQVARNCSTPPGSWSIQRTVTSTSPTNASNRRGGLRPQRHVLRQWGKQATQQEIEAGTGGAFAQLVHCIAMSRAGLIYVRPAGQRAQVFDKRGTFIKNIWIKTGTPTLPDPRGTVWWIAFSKDLTRSS